MRRFLLVFILSIPSIVFSNPNDSDGDGFSDLQEISYGSGVYDPFDFPVGGGAANEIVIALENGDQDAEQRGNGDIWKVDEDLDIRGDGTTTHFALRYLVNLPTGSNITEAYIQFVSSEYRTISSSVSIAIEDSVDAASFSSSSNDISNRLNLASVQWSNIPAWSNNESNTDQQTPDLSNLIMNVLAKPGWLAGNHIVFKFYNGSGRRAAHAFNQNPSKAAKLHLVLNEAGELPEFYVDTDSDGIEDYLDDDDDDDGLPDTLEQQLGSNHRSSNGDGDQLADYYEYMIGASPADYEFFEEVSGKVIANYWLNLGCGGHSCNISHLENFASFPLVPSVNVELESLDSTDSGYEDSNNEFGVIISGIITAPETGSYRFWVAGDNHTELWLAEDEYGENIEKIASVIEWTYKGEWNKYPEQESVLINLQAGGKYAFIVKNIDGLGSDHYAVSWQKPSHGASQSEIIPSNNISYLKVVLDDDGDGLSNEEEVLLGTDPNNSHSDTDSFSDYDEVKWLNTDPTITDDFLEWAGYVETRYWLNLDCVGHSCGINHLLQNAQYPINPSVIKIHNELDSQNTNFENLYNEFGIEIVGYITAPEDGFYTFWISGDNGAEFWLSSNEGAKALSKIAFYSGYTERDEWEKYLTQQSESIYLEANEKYAFRFRIIDGLAEDFYSIAWQKPSDTQKEIIGTEYLSFMAADLDYDGDGLTLSEELALDTDPFEIDTDNDGLSDGEEILGGTEPLNPDSDGDGFSDLQEVNYGSSATNPFDFPVGGGTHYAISLQNNLSDIEEAVNGTVYDNTELNLQFTTVAAYTNFAAVRYQIDVTQGEQVNNAYIQFVSYGNHSNETDILISIEDTAAAAAFALTSTNITNRSYLPAIAWNDISEWTTNEDSNAQRTPDLSTLINSILSKPNWQANNNIVFKFQGVEGGRYAYAYNSDPSKAPVLHFDIGYLPAFFVDTDSDGIEDYLDDDDDNDGLTDIEEQALGLDHRNPDTDGDGFTDGDEVVQGTDPDDDQKYPGSTNVDYVTGAMDIRAQVMGGALGVSLPIAVPDGVGGLQPSLALAYNSSGTNGAYGMGWNLTGLGSISRCAYSSMRDGEIGSVDFSADDQFCMGGERFVLVSGVHGELSAEYRTENDQFVRITIDEVDSGKPTKFKIQDRNGMLSYYGGAATTHANHTNAGTNDILSWLIESQEDPYGNTINFVYLDNGQRLDKVVYDGGEVQLIYADRADKLKYFIHGTENNLAHLVEKIEVYRTDPSPSTFERTQLFREYILSYDFNAESQRSQLVKVTECVKNQKCLNPTQFDYAITDQGYEASISSQLTKNFTDREHILSMDIDGDGIEEILEYRVEMVAVGSQSTQIFNLSDNLTVPIYKMVNGLPVDASSEVFLAHLTKTKINNDAYDDLMAIQIDGDGGFASLVGFGYRGTAGNLKLKYLINDGVGGFEVRSVSLFNQVAYSSYAGLITPASQDLTDSIFSAIGTHIQPRVLDFNGDGYQDISYCEPVLQLISTGIADKTWTYQVVLNDRNEGWESKINTGVACGEIDAGIGTIVTTYKNFVTADLDANGLQDFLVPTENGVAWEAVYSNATFTEDAQTGDVSSSLTFNNVQANVTAEYSKSIFADVNGDYLLDILFRDSSGDLYLQYNSGLAGANTYLAPINTNLNFVNFSNAQVIDFNDDGLSDILFFDGDASGNLSVLISNGLGGFSTQITNLAASGTHFFSDTNGNGLADFVRKADASNTWDIQLRKADGIEYLPISDYMTQVSYGSGINQHVSYDLLNKGNIYTFSPVSTEEQVIPAIGPFLMVSEFSTEDGSEGEQSTFYQYQNLRLHMSNIGSLGFEKLNTYTEYKNGSAPLKYQYTSTIFSQDYNKQMVGMNLEQESGIATCMDPENASCHQVFSQTSNIWKTKVVDELNVLVCEATSDTTDVCVTHNYDKNIALRSTQHLSESELFTYELDGTLVSQDTSSNNYDDYGNNILSIETKKGGGKIFETTTVSAYSFDDPVNWYLGKRSSLTTTVKEFDDVGGAPVEIASETRQSAFTYYPYNDANAPGAIHTSTSNINDPEFSIIKTFTYNNYGLLESTVVSGQGVLTRTSSQTYDSSYRWLATETNTLNHTNSFSQYHPVHGKPQQTNSINNLVTTIFYNDFGLVESQFFADGTSKQFERDFCASNCPDSRAVSYVKETNTAGTSSYVYKDILDRQVLSSTTSLNGEIVYTRNEYDNLNRLVKSSIPYFLGDPIYYKTITSFDDMNRAIVVSEPSGTVITASYTARESQTKVEYIDRLTSQVIEKNTTTRFDVRGKEIAVIDNLNKQLTYQYDVLGNLRFTIDSLNNSVEMRYDLNSNKNYIDDPDAGISNYYSSALGELLLSENANGYKTCYVYDVAGRNIKRYENFQPSLTFAEAKPLALNNCQTAASPDTVWSYDQRWLGGLNTITGLNGYQKDNYYDALGRVTSTVEQIDGTSYTASKTYFGLSSNNNEIGQIETVTFPSSQLSVSYRYNSYGILDAISDSTGKILWELESVNARGQTKEEKMIGGLIVRTHDYEDTTGLLQNIRTLRGLDILQDNYFTFNSIGDLQQRAEVLPALDGFAARDLEEIFAYDSLRRLKTTTLTNYAIAGPAEVQSINYDDIGNITYKSDVGDYKYGSACTNGGFGPHAVCEITNGGVNNTSFIYDDSGNMESGDGKVIEYTTFGKPKKITGPEGETQFVYGPERKRIKRTDIQGSDTTVTTYVGGVFERVQRPNNDVEEKMYVSGFGVMTFTTPNGGGTVTKAEDYLLTDNLGSVVAILDDIANVKQRFSYDPWGERRKEDVWQMYTDSEIYNFQPLTNLSGVLGLANSVTTKGFTGHEMIDTVNLIHMNGRVYNPKLGRFLSADPIIKEVDNQQNYNRYSYVLNNPLSYIDPTGHYQVSSNFVSGAESSAGGGSNRAGINLAALGAGLLFVGAMVAIIDNVINNSNGRELGRAITQSFVIPLLVAGTCIVAGPVCVLAALIVIPAAIKQQRQARELSRMRGANMAGFINGFNTMSRVSGALHKAQQESISNWMSSIGDGWQVQHEASIASYDQMLAESAASNAQMGAMSSSGLYGGGSDYSWIIGLDSEPDYSGYGESGYEYTVDFSGYPNVGEPYNNSSSQLSYNAPPPQTVPPTGVNLEYLQCTADCIGLNSLQISGGQETSGHSSNSAHYSNLAVDIPNYPANDVTSDVILECAGSCGYTHGHNEGGHTHVQIGGANYVNPDAHEL